MLYVRVETWSASTSGHVWCRRWSEPYEVAHGYMLFTDGEFTDWLTDREELSRDLHDWSRNRLRYVGEVFDVEWLDDEASRHARDDMFGLDPL